VATETTLRGARYLQAKPSSQRLARYIIEDLPYLDYGQTMRWYAQVVPTLDKQDRALLGCNDRYFLLVALCGRKDALHPWLFNRCREVEADPDGYLDLWSRYHFKSSIITFAGVLQEVLCDPEITVCILSCTKDIARAFLLQIQQEMEQNADLQDLYSDVLWAVPTKEAPRWSRESGIVVKRKTNPKEATVEAHGLIDGQPTSRHYRLLVYDDIVTQDLVTTPETIKKVTERWELSDNLGTHGATRKQHAGTRYHFGDTYGIILERGTLKPRIYPATDDGLLTGNPVLLTPERWEQVKDAQRSTVSAQMLLNPVAGNEAIFRVEWFRPYDVRPTMLNVYIMVDPSKGRTNRSDRTAISVVGVDVAGNRYLLDGVRHRMQLSERWHHLKALYQKWSIATGVQIVIVGYERYGAQTEDEVIKLWQERDGVSFELVELAWPKEGPHAKPDRVSRLEPDFRAGRFYLPATVYRPDMGGTCLWRVEDNKIVYRKMMGPTKAQKHVEATSQGYRVVTPIRRVDEDRQVYDLTACLMEEMRFYPFSPKDDLVDATSRLYDLEPKPAVPFEGRDAEAKIYPDT
jgi:hypothetical protein